MSKNQIVHWKANTKRVTMIAEHEDVVPRDRYRVAVPEWVENDGIAEMIGFELEQMGYSPVLFFFDSNIPADVDYLLTFGPYNRILPIWQNNARIVPSRRPVVIHWNTEGMPDLRIPPKVVSALGAMRSKIGRMGYSGSLFDHFLYSIRPVSNIDQSFKRFRFHGDYEYACRKGWLHVLSDTSHIYSQIRSKIGIPTLYAPWGVSHRWYEDLGLERDLAGNTSIIGSGEAGVAGDKMIATLTDEMGYRVITMVSGPHVLDLLLRAKRLDLLYVTQAQVEIPFDDPEKVQTILLGGKKISELQEFRLAHQFMQENVVTEAGSRISQAFFRYDRKDLLW